MDDLGLNWSNILDDLKRNADSCDKYQLVIELIEGFLPQARPSSQQAWHDGPANGKAAAAKAERLATAKPSEPLSQG